jgi:hypothetical protein
MAGKSLKKRVQALKKAVASESSSARDPGMTWVHEASGNVIYGRLLSLHAPEGGAPPYYRVKLLDSCMVKPSRPGRGKKSYVTHGTVGMIVSVVETGDISCLRYFVDEITQKGDVYDVWIRWMAFRQEVQVKKIEVSVPVGRRLP